MARTCPPLSGEERRRLRDLDLCDPPQDYFTDFTNGRPILEPPLREHDWYFLHFELLIAKYHSGDAIETVITERCRRCGKEQEHRVPGYETAQQFIEGVGGTWTR